MLNGSILVTGEIEVNIENISHICLWDRHRGEANQALPAHIHVPRDINHDYSLIIFLKDKSKIIITAEDIKKDLKYDLHIIEKRKILNEKYRNIILQMSEINNE